MSDPTPAFAASHLKRFSREHRLVAISEWPELLETLIDQAEQVEAVRTEMATWSGVGNVVVEQVQTWHRRLGAGTPHAPVPRV
jgi:hypothetical protein